MKSILVFKTSSDATLEKLFAELQGDSIDCLIQSSQLNRYQIEYPCINFIDICREGFYDLPIQVLDKILLKSYDKVYITFTGIKGHNYGNVMELVSMVNYKKAFFYNCKGDILEIPQRNVLKDMICRAYIWICEMIYRLRGDL